jgi:hypothetical protein
MLAGHAADRGLTGGEERTSGPNLWARVISHLARREHFRMGRSTPTSPDRESCTNWITRIAAVYDLVYARRWWFRLGDIVDHNPALPDEDNLYTVLGDWYARYVAVGVRRHVDASTDADSLLRLLNTLAEYPELTLSAQELARLYPPGMAGVAPSDLLSRLGPDWPAAYIERLVRVADPIRRYVNKHVAHLTRVESPATYKDLHDALDAVIDGTLAAQFALTGSAPRRESWETAAEQFDWAKTLRVVWVTPDVWAHVRDS